MTRTHTLALAALLALTAAAPMTALAAPKAKAHTQKSHEEFATGAIASISAQEVKLAGGETFRLAPGVNAASYKPGDKVSVRFTLKNGARTADQILAANK